MLHIALYHPEIPPNTGNIMRLCANTGFRLHLIGPLGFDLDDKKLRRAGLDYSEWATVSTHASLQDFIAASNPGRLYACSARGRRNHTEARYQPGDALLFGPESQGLAEAILAPLDPEQILRLPMQPNSRSLNLSNSVSIFVYEAWRQLGFKGGI
jgi:tRNA (cytidine/uridine-2'-O-)-methyltransferase